VSLNENHTLLADEGKGGVAEELAWNKGVVNRAESTRMCSCSKALPIHSKGRSSLVELRASAPLGSASQFDLLDIRDSLGDEVLFHGIQVVGPNA